MDKIKDTRTFMRITHRYLGFSLQELWWFMP